jgi:hypothetical protein
VFSGIILISSRKHCVSGTCYECKFSVLCNFTSYKLQVLGVQFAKNLFFCCALVQQAFAFFDLFVQPASQNDLVSFAGK